MSERNYSAKVYQDQLFGFEGGMNSGVSPLLLPKNQLAFALNASIRGGFVQVRPAYQIQTLNFNGNTALQNIVLKGKFQGATYYKPDYGLQTMIAQISGHLVLFTLTGSVWNVTDISIPNDLNSAVPLQVWLWQAENYVIVQDGTGKMPIFYNGTSSRRSYGPSQVLGNMTSAPASVPAIGANVTVTLQSAYTGPYNVPVIFNKEYYQATPSVGNQVTLTNLTDVAGTVHNSQSSVTLNPNQSYVVSAGNGGGTPQNFVFTSSVSLGTASFSVGFSDRVPTYNAQIYSNNPTYQYRVITTGAIPSAGTVVTNLSSNLTAYTVGNLSTQIVAPAIGSSISAFLSQPYSGATGQIVQIGNGLYSITPVANQQSGGTTLLLTNLTDTSTSYSNSDLTIRSVPELPAGRMGAYGMGVNCMSLTDGVSYIISDVVGAGSGTPANNYRDAILKVTQNDFLFGGGSFRIPGSGEQIAAICFPAQLDTSLGQGPLQVATPYAFYSNITPGTNPAAWATLTTPIQTESLKDRGALGQNSTIQVNSDTFFRSSDGISTLIMARREFFDWGNKPSSNELLRILSQDNQALLSYTSATSFDNRFLCTADPQQYANGVTHTGIISLNFDLLSTMRSNTPPSWEGLWTGINAYQMVTGRFSNVKRCFAFTLNNLTGNNEIYELLPEFAQQFADNGTNPILWAFETPVVFKQDVKPMSELIQLRDGEIYLSAISGTVGIKVYYRPDFYPCWTLWNSFSVSQSTDNSGQSQNGYRMRVGLGQPDGMASEANNNRPLRNGYFFQFRFEITGSCIFNGMRVSAIEQPQAVFAPVEPDGVATQTIDCTIPNDMLLYSLQGATA